MGANFGHQEGLIAAALQSLAHPVFTFAAMIFPAVIEESDAAIEGFVDQGDGGRFIFGGAEMVAAHAERGDFYAFMFAELAQRNGGGGGAGLIRCCGFGWFAKRFHGASLMRF